MPETVHPMLPLKAWNLSTTTARKSNPVCGKLIHAECPTYSYLIHILNIQRIHFITVLSNIKLRRVKMITLKSDVYTM